MGGFCAEWGIYRNTWMHHTSFDEKGRLNFPNNSWEIFPPNYLSASFWTKHVNDKLRGSSRWVTHGSSEGEPTCDPWTDQLWSDLIWSDLLKTRVSAADSHGGCFELQTRGLGGLLWVVRVWWTVIGKFWPLGFRLRLFTGWHSGCLDL